MNNSIVPFRGLTKMSYMYIMCHALIWSHPIYLVYTILSLYIITNIDIIAYKCLTVPNSMYEYPFNINLNNVWLSKLSKIILSKAKDQKDILGLGHG